MFYLDIFRALQKHDVQYVVVGGIAINLHGVERATMDVDLVLAMDEANLQRFLRAATELELKPSLPVRIESLCDAAQLDEWVREKHMIALSLRSSSKTAPSVDIIVRPKVSFETMYRNRVEKDIGGVRLKLASVGPDCAEDRYGTNEGCLRHRRAEQSQTACSARRTRRSGFCHTPQILRGRTEFFRFIHAARRSMADIR